MKETKGKQKQTFRTHVGSSQMYKYYLKNRPLKGLDRDYNVSRKEYRDIVCDFNKEIAEEIVVNAYEFIMPSKLGTIFVGKRKSRIELDENGEVKYTNYPIDWMESKKRGKIIRNFNEHTDGYRCYWCYTKTTANYNNKSIYFFRATRTNTRFLAKVLKDKENYPNVDFYEI